MSTSSSRSPRAVNFAWPQPLRSIVADAVDGGLSVFAVEAEGQRATAHARPVRVVKVVGDDAVVAGLRPHESVVTVGAPLLHDGDVIRLIP